MVGFLEDHGEMSKAFADEAEKGILAIEAEAAAPDVESLMTSLGSAVDRAKSAEAQVAALVEALERMLRHVEMPLDPNCHCVLMTRELLSDLSGRKS
jgi:hypothetical protein